MYAYLIRVGFCLVTIYHCVKIINSTSWLDADIVPGEALRKYLDEKSCVFWVTIHISVFFYWP